MKIIRPGTFVKALIGGRIRHARVMVVTDQNNVQVRVGDLGSSTTVNADRVASTVTRGTLFVEE